MSTDSHHAIVVAGAGLSGLAAAWRLHSAGHEPLVLEARDAAGGRIQSFVSDSGAYLGDQGPSWVWPDYQPVVRRWLDELGMARYPQYADGQSVLDLGPGQAPRVSFLPAQLGSERLEQGPRALVDALLARLPEDSVRTGHALSSVTPGEGKLTLEVRTDNSVHRLTTDQLVVALPPRIALATVDWRAALPSGLTRIMQATPTWMAPHAKAVVVYERAFWRDAGLSGRIASQAGPLGEVHDHCGPSGAAPAALFGFFSWPAELRRQRASAIASAIREQLARAFGDAAPRPVEVRVKDWSCDPHVATADDLSGPAMHPEVGPALLRDAHLGGRVWFAGAECAARSPGLIEGALDVADGVAKALGRLGRAPLGRPGRAPLG